jgi:hypothetical protein
VSLCHHRRGRSEKDDGVEEVEEADSAEEFKQD